MVLTLKYKLALKPSLRLVLPSLSCYSTTVTIAVPPIRAALVEHAKCAAYQVGDCWGQALVPSPVLPSPQEWGWTLDEGI